MKKFVKATILALSITSVFAFSVSAQSIAPVKQPIIKPLIHGEEG